MGHRVTLIPGDGTGPELTEATRRVLDALGVHEVASVVHRDVAIQPRILGAVDLPHAAGAERCDDLVRAQTGTGLKSHLRAIIWITWTRTEKTAAG